MTTIVILTAVFLLLGYDFFAMFKMGKGNTISEVIQQASFKRPLIPFLFGLVMGHWFWGV